MCADETAEFIIFLKLFFLVFEKERERVNFVRSHQDRALRYDQAANGLRVSSRLPYELFQRTPNLIKTIGLTPGAFPAFAMCECDQRQATMKLNKLELVS